MTVKVELHQVPEGGSEYQAVAWMTAAGDSWEVTDPEGLFPTELHVLVAGKGDQLRKVRLEDDPETWARNLDSVLRTGYLVPVVTHDDSGNGS